MDKQRELQAIAASTHKSSASEVKLINKAKDKNNDGGYIWII